MALIFLTLFVISLQGFINAQQTPSRLNFFDIDLLRYCAEERRGNIMVSPASIKATLSMLLEGAYGDTEGEIRSALRLSREKDEYREQLNLFLEGLRTNSSGVTIQNANAIFYSQKLKLKKDYADQLKYVYLAQAYKMNFSNPDRSVKLINGWVSNQTKGLIDNIVDIVNLDPSLDMILANGLYFKGIWQHSFDPQLTIGECFYVQSVCTKVAMMDLRTMLKYAYIEELRAHAVELPYQDQRYSMIVLIPLDRDGCAPLIRDLPYMSLHHIFGLLEPTDVQLFMPKFTIDYAEDMVLPLRNMRITNLFTTASNLSGIFEDETAFVNSMYHKVHMSVDEQGTIAAAATAAQVIPLIENGITLRVDRPFVFFIRDNKMGLALFEGRIEEPTVFVEANDKNVEKPKEEQKPKEEEKPKEEQKPTGEQLQRSYKSL